MRLKLMAGAAAATALFAASGASAQGMWDNWFDGGQWYVGAEGGYGFPNDFRAHSTELASDGAPYHWDFDPSKNSWMAIAKVGYHFSSGIRVEAEYGYRNGEILSVLGDADRAQPNKLCAIGGSGNAASVGCGRPDGHINVQSLMANVIYEVPWHPTFMGSAIVPFIGGGAGGAQLETSINGELSGVPAGYAPTIRHPSRIRAWRV
jgi:opacity protein-like surface antigen